MTFNLLAVIVICAVLAIIFGVIAIFVYRKHHAKMDATLDQISTQFKQLQTSVDSKTANVSSQFNKSLDKAKDELKEHASDTAVKAAEAAVQGAVTQIADHTKEAVASVSETLQDAIAKKDTQGS